MKSEVENIHVRTYFPSSQRNSARQPAVVVSAIGLWFAQQQQQQHLQQSTPPSVGTYLNLQPWKCVTWGPALLTNGSFLNGPTRYDFWAAAPVGDEVL